MNEIKLKETLREYCEFILSQRKEDFFEIYELGEERFEWYMIFYPLRALVLGGELLREKKYIEAVFPYFDRYVSEQLPNGGFTSNYRRMPTEKLDHETYRNIHRYGKINMGDNGSNILSMMQVIKYCDDERREKYLSAAKRWFDEWVITQALLDGGYANGTWEGFKVGAAYTCGMTNLCCAFASYSIITKEKKYADLAKECMLYQYKFWTDEIEDGRPIFLENYPNVCKKYLNDFSHSYYMLEAMCWCLEAIDDIDFIEETKKKMKGMIFGKKGLLSQWGDSWFNYMSRARTTEETRFGIRLGWEMAKTNGIIQFFTYYQNNIEKSDMLEEKIKLAHKSLCNKGMSKMSGVMSDPKESYGTFALQSTGYGGLSLAEAICANKVFDIV